MWPFRKREDRALWQWQVGDAFSGPSSDAGVAVTPDTALRLSAVWGCVRLLADVVSELPLHVFRDGTRERVDPPRVLVEPAAGTELPEWIWTSMVSWLLRGRVMGLIVDRTGLTRPSQIELINPDRVTVQTQDRVTVWRLDGQEIDPSELWHRSVYRMPGEVLGKSPIGYFRNAIGLGLAAETYGAKFFRDDATPSGILTVDGAWNGDQVEIVRERWNARKKGNRGIAVVSGVKFQPISIAPDESQFLDTQRFSVQQICRIFGCPPEMVAADSGAAMTYANVEQRDLSLLKYAAGPWLGRFERAADTLLPRGQYAKFNASAFLRTDTLSRYQAHEIGLRNGFLTIEEVRDLEEREPLPAAARPRSVEAVA